MADTNSEVRDRLAERPIVPIPIPTTSADLTLVTLPVLLVGWSLRETTGSGAAVAEFIAGQSTTNEVAGEQALASGGTGSQFLGDEGLLCEAGLLVHRVSGTFTGCVWVRI